MTTVFLHGFWGQPSDWNEVLQRLPLGAPVWIPDLYATGPHSPHHTLKQWVAHFHDELERRFAGESVQLVGYSMGGRLGLNAALVNPKRFKRTLLLSTSPFMTEALGSLQERQAWEAEWLKRFESDDWESLEKAWQDQAVFRHSQPQPDRRRDPPMREMLSLSLRQWSVTQHSFSADAVMALPATVDWAFGALDQKYCEVAKILRNLPVQGQIKSFENAGHRIPWETPGEVAQWVIMGGL